MAQPILHSPHTGCASHANVTFAVPHRDGKLTVALPSEHALCPHVWIAVSLIQSSKVFYAAMQQLNQSGGMHLPYGRSAAASAKWHSSRWDSPGASPMPRFRNPRKWALQRSRRTPTGTDCGVRTIPFIGTAIY